MKKLIQNISVVSIVAISAFAFTSCAAKKGSCCGTCSVEKSCPAGCAKACCAAKK